MDKRHAKRTACLIMSTMAWKMRNDFNLESEISDLDISKILDALEELEIELDRRGRTCEDRLALSLKDAVDMSREQ